ncbi:MAG: glycosyltransferase family 39 protein [Chloroflexi bacterium]|nr:glycosyltransferase family 39 protein [Chloroflexota bacterium]
MKRATLILIALLALAAGLRFYRIDAQSLWSDEGSSVAQSLRDIPAIAGNAARDIHPPLYYIALHFWVLPFGTSEAAVRGLSALLGVALVALCYALGRRLYGEPAAFVAAFLAAVNPFQVYYAQEARMYMLMAVLGALCVLASLWWLDDDARTRRLGLLVYAVAAVLGLYTHYFFPVVIAVCNVIVVARWLAVGRVTRQLAVWLVAQGVVLLAFAPWLPVALHQVTTWPAGAQTFTATDAPLVLWRLLALGLSAPRDAGLALALCGLLALAGLYVRGAAGSTRAARWAASPTFVVVLYLLAPVALMFTLALFKDAFLKFMLIASPPFVLLAANGVVNIGRGAAGRNRFAVVVRGVSAAAFLGAVAFWSALSLQSYFTDPQYARDDYRSLAGLIDALGRNGDAVILDAPGQQEIFGYYYRDSLPVYPLPRQRPADRAATETELAAITARHGRLFVVFWATDESDPQRLVEAWLDAHAYKASEAWYGNVRLALYAAVATASAPSRMLNLRWGDRITLRGASQPDGPVAAGEIMPLTLFWTAEQAVGARYKVFVHLLDPRGFVVAQRDSEPVGGSRPTTSWVAGETIADPYGLFIPPGTAPLAYPIEIGLYDPESGRRLRLSNGDDRLLLPSLRVEATLSARAIPGLVPLEGGARANGLILIGYHLDLVGAEGQRVASVPRGARLRLSLYWRKPGGMQGNGEYRWQLGSARKQTTPTDGLYPVWQWREGEVVRDDQLVPVPADLPAGAYELLVDGRVIARVDVRTSD